MTDPERPSEAVLEKVRKLLALGASPSEAEAAAAVEKARVLLARWGMTLSDIEKEKLSTLEETLLEKKRLRPWELDLISVVSQATFTKALRSNGQILIIGRQLNVSSAQALFSYLHPLVVFLGRAYNSPTLHVESFRRGVVNRLWQRLKANLAETADGANSTAARQAQEERTLVVQMEQVTERENAAHMAAKHGPTKTIRTKRTVHGESFQRGKVVGNTISLDHQPFTTSRAVRTLPKGGLT
ncbi:MAG: DUF2786 domain-containing protein [Spirochaetales bacterium]|nr:DUF2786 domain-containing protein [Spirochaetales bacterium]